MSFGSGGSWSKPFDMDSGKPAFKSRALRPELFESQGPSPQTPRRDLVYRLGIPTRPRHFGEHRSCLGFVPAPEPTLKSLVSHSPVLLGVRQIRIAPLVQN